MFQLGALASLALRLVENDTQAAARAAGYTTGPVFHSTGYYNGWTVFQTRGAFGKAGYGSYFSDEAGAALFAQYAERFQMPKNWKGVPKNVRTFSVYLRITKPFIIDHVDDVKPHLDHGQSFGVHSDYQKNRPPSKTRLEQAGYDAIITSETTAPKVHATRGLKILPKDDPKAAKFPVIVVFEPTQIKLADPITYDNDGNPIPLEQRFDPTNPDIRY